MTESDIIGTYCSEMTAAELPPAMPAPVQERFVGTWELTIGRSGHYLVKKDGVVQVEGDHSRTDDGALVLIDTGGPLACRKPGTERGIYAAARTSDRFTLTAMTEPCIGRGLVLDGRTWTLKH